MLKNMQCILADKIFMVWLPATPCICYELEIWQKKIFVNVL